MHHPKLTQESLKNNSGLKLITTKNVFTISLIVAVLTLLFIWLSGLGVHRSLFVNSMLSASILSIAFFAFLTLGLYNGIKLRDNLGKISDKLNIKVLNPGDGIDFSVDIPDIGDSAGGIILGIVIWILFSVLLLILIWFFGTIVWTMVIFFIAMLYWIFFRALRLVFKNSNKCRGNVGRSMKTAIAYTALYVSWIYGIILATHYLLH